MNNKLSRREFLTAATAATAAAATLSQSASGGGAEAERSNFSTTLPPTIRVGIIGLEGHYSEITDAARTHPNIQVTAVADSRPAALEAAARSKALGKATPWTDYRKMLEAERLDLVCVCGENGTRAEVVRACVARGLAVVAEKPLAVSLPELAGLKRMIERRGVPLTILLTMRFSGPYQAMHRMVRSGAIGEVVSMDSQKSYKLGTRPAWMKVRKSFGGSIPYVGIHMIDLMRWISGREFIEAAAFHSNAGGSEIGELENNAAVLFRLDNRGTASFRLDYLRPETAPTHGDDRLRIVGRKGVIEYQQSEGLTLLNADQPGKQVIADLPQTRPLFLDFLDSVYNRNPHLISLSDIFRISEIVLKARDAADGNRVVRL